MTVMVIVLPLSQPVGVLMGGSAGGSSETGGVGSSGGGVDISGGGVGSLGGGSLWTEV